MKAPGSNNNRCSRSPGCSSYAAHNSKTFIRFVGNSLYPSDYPRIDNWAKRFKKWMDQGIEEIYFFMHTHDEGKSLELSQYVVKQFNKVCKLDLPPVEFVK